MENPEKLPYYNLTVCSSKTILFLNLNILSVVFNTPFYYRNYGEKFIFILTVIIKEKLGPCHQDMVSLDFAVGGMSSI